MIPRSEGRGAVLRLLVRARSIREARFLFSFLLVAGAAFSMAPTVTPSPSPTVVSTTTVSISSVMQGCWEGWTGIPFAGKVELNVSSSSGPVDLYIFTEWEGRGEEVFESSVCQLGHPSSTSQNCGLITTPPQCVFSAAQIVDGNYSVNLPQSLGSYYYAVFTQCCSANDSTVNLVMAGTSELLSSVNQRYFASITPYVVSSLNVTLNSHSPVPPFNVTSYVSVASHSPFSFPTSINLEGLPSDTLQPPNFTQTFNVFSSVLSHIAPVLMLFGGIEILVIGVLAKPFKPGKLPKVVSKKCADCGKEPYSGSTATLTWDYCEVCHRRVCTNCLERSHNDRCDLKSPSKKKAPKRPDTIL